VLNERSSLTDKSSLSLLGPAQTQATVDTSKAMRVTVRMRFDSGRSIASEAVIFIDGRDEPYQVLSWQNEADAQTQTNVGGRL